MAQDITSNSRSISLIAEYFGKLQKTMDTYSNNLTKSMDNKTVGDKLDRLGIIRPDKKSRLAEQLAYTTEAELKEEERLADERKTAAKRAGSGVELTYGAGTGTKINRGAGSGIEGVGKQFLPRELTDKEKKALEKARKKAEADEKRRLAKLAAEEKRRQAKIFSEQKAIDAVGLSIHKLTNRLVNMGSMFDKVVTEKFSAPKLMKRSEQNFTAMSKWATNLSKLESQGFSPSMIQGLREEGEAGYGRTDALANKLSDEQRKKVISQYQQSRALASGIAEKQVRYDEKVKDISIVVSNNTILNKEMVDKLTDEMMKKLRLSGL